ncbi:AraC family transcriptional regulator [Paraburkholderia edwinii]|jgi:AraC-like DNA-binding protein|uniref:AraC family transcriptional regulator n=1 Tax=Paraburkholderia edwinii TaxID=2861782 RepID=A0ABX8UEF1_9BURK|nr:AraC family transcriptional regulator [Paraburkholderia edwinii]QYD66933.1 AraC family transcriptional regulator [Paraburkholderia edwinii]
MNIEKNGIGADGQRPACCVQQDSPNGTQGLSVPGPRRVLVAMEERWRVPPPYQYVPDANAMVDPGGMHGLIEAVDAHDARRDLVIASRWTQHEIDGVEHMSRSAAGQHTVGIVLKPTTVHFRSGSLVFDGQLAPGSMHVTGPGESAAAVFRAASDAIHLFIPQRVLEQHYEEAFGRPHAGELALGVSQITRDTSLERLSRALADIQYADATFASLYVDSICIAIVARLLERHFTRRAPPTVTRATPLPQWRLRRAFDFIDAHLAEPVRLGDIAASVGLTRMHFAAQFRCSTGYTPHTYLLRRRVEHAQRLLQRSEKTLLDVALDCGFRSQAHFTTVFRRMVGDTPNRWRIKARLD